MALPAVGVAQTTPLSALASSMAGTWAIGSTAKCTSAPFQVGLNGQTLSFKDSKGNIDEERVSDGTAELFSTRTTRSGSVPVGSVWSYKRQADGSLLVRNQANGSSFSLFRCDTGSRGIDVARPLDMPIIGPGVALPPPAGTAQQSRASTAAPGSGQAEEATLRPTPLASQQGGGAFAGVGPSQPVAGNGRAGVQQSTSDGKIVQTVVADGIGSTIESAVQNAAENALKQVVGTFVDTNTQIERRTQISEGLRSETRNIRRDMREYSQGSIQGFEVLDNRMDGAIHRVTAKVAVRIDDFKVYVKTLTEAEAAVGRGLFAQLATEEKNTQSASQLVAKNIFEPLVAGEVIRFKVLSPMKAEDIIQKEGLNPALREQFNIAIPIIAYIDEGFAQGLQTLLRSIAADSQDLNLQEFYGGGSDKNGEKCGRWTRSGPYKPAYIPNDISVNLQKINFVSGDISNPHNRRVNGTMTAFRLKDIANSPEMRKFLIFKYGEWSLSGTLSPALRVELLGRDGPLFQSTVNVNSAFPDNRSGPFARGGYISADRLVFVNKSPSKIFNLFGPNICQSTVVVDMSASDSIFIFMKVPLEILASTQSVVVRLAK
jgi:hypothetical protein